MATINARFQFKRDTAADWTLNNPVLLDGELGWETDTRRTKMGDGVKTWNQLSYGGIVGPAGAVGPIGQTGATGLTGATGAPGATGATGAPGADGEDGLGVPAGGTTGQVLAKSSNADNDTEWFTLPTTKYSTTIGNGTDDVIVVTHNLGTRDIDLSLRLAGSPYTGVMCDWEATTVNTVTLTFYDPPTSNELRVSVTS